MTHLAVSDTPLSRTLLQAGRLEVDHFETSGPLTESAVSNLADTQIPLLLHNSVWNWSLGDPNALTETDVLQKTQQRLALTGAPWLSVHLGYSAVSVAFEKGVGFRPALADKQQPSAALLETIIYNVGALKAALDVPLLLENLDYNPTGAYDHVCEPAFIAEVLTTTETGLLLDLAHAQVSASQLGYGIWEYLTALPLERVNALHVSAPRPDGRTLKDAHEPLRAEDYELLAEVLAQTNPWAVTLEYGADEAALQEQLAKMRQQLGA